MSHTQDETGTADENILRRALTRFKRCEEWERDFRNNYRMDTRFANGDSYNNYQWPQPVAQRMQQDTTPMLTVNKTRQHNLQIINDAKQNKPGVIIRPVGGEASFDAAQTFEGIVRHIEYISNAEQAYDSATTTQVEGGIGYWRVVTDYVGENTFDQDIFIRRIKDPLSVYIDPDINEVDGSDANFAYVFEDLSREAFEIEFPDVDCTPGLPFGMSGTAVFITQDMVRVCEYYEKERKLDKLVAFVDEKTGERKFVRKSQIPPDLYKQLKEQNDFDEREVVTDKIMWYKIAGHEIIDRRELLGKYIPIVRVIGEEVVIDGRMDRKGHTRSMIDPQRMYNYWTSAATEHVALQNKIPYIAGARAISGYENYWKTANRSNYSYLPYNDVDENGNAIAAPQRQQPPVASDAYMKGMQIAQTEMMMASGQYQAQMGQNENAKSGVAINARQRQGDRATYHFIDGLAVGIRFTGKILLDLIPKVYDTPRVIRILAEDGEEQEIQVDPMQKEALQEQREPGENKVKRIFNPNVGTYEVISDVGPGYATRRQEAFNAFSQIIAQNPQALQIVGDLMFKNADFPGADEIARRLKRGIPPQYTKDGPSPQETQLMQQVQQMQQLFEEMTKLLAEKEEELKNKDQENSVREYDAESKRITAVAGASEKLGIDTLAPLIAQMVVDALQSNAAIQMPAEQADMADPSATMGAPGGEMPSM